MIWRALGKAWGALIKARLKGNIAQHKQTATRARSETYRSLQSTKLSGLARPSKVQDPNSDGIFFVGGFAQASQPFGLRISNMSQTIYKGLRTYLKHSGKPNIQKQLGYSQESSFFLVLLLMIRNLFCGESIHRYLLNLVCALLLVGALFFCFLYVIILHLKP